MLSWFKRLWLKPHAPNEVVLSAAEILQWTQNLQQTCLSKMQAVMDTCSPLIVEAIANVEARLNKLLDASLLNENIPERHRQICDGNRQAYADRLRRLTSTILLPKTEELAEFFASSANAMRDFAENSARQKQVLGEFFAVELREIGSALLDVENLINQLKHQWIQERVQIALSLYQEATDLDNCLSQREQLEEDAKDTFRLSEQAAQQHKHASALAKEAEADPELAKLRQEHNILLNNKRALEANIKEKFAPLDVALKKYARLAPASATLAENYSSDPLAALSQDVHLHIINVLAELQKLAWSDQLELKQDKKNKAILAIANLTKNYLRESIASYARLCKEEQQASQAATRHASAIEAVALRQDAEQARLRHARQAEEAERLAKAAARIDVAGMIETFQTHATEFTGKPIRIVQELTST